MRIKVPGTLITFPRNGEFLIYNYLTKQAMSCDANALYWLTVASDWTDISDIVAAHEDIDPESIKEELLTLVEAGILIAENTANAEAEAKYSSSWELGPAAGMFHCTMLDNNFVSAAESTRRQAQRATQRPSPVLMWKNSANAIPLPRHNSAKTEQLFAIMRRRRSNRNTLKNAITLQELGECLFAGLGITGYTKTDTAILPLKMTPSGGGRNPFEAFIWARNVDGLAEGIYHYSAYNHSLEKIKSETELTPVDLTLGQDWTQDMPAIIFFVAVLSRTTWKYNDPNAYRVVMIEAGHIAQNMILACTGNDLTACPTAAIAHSKISALLGLSDVTDTPVYALLIGKSSSVADKVITNEFGQPLANFAETQYDLAMVYREAS